MRVRIIFLSTSYLISAPLTALFHLRFTMLPLAIPLANLHVRGRFIYNFSRVPKQRLENPA